MDHRDLGQKLDLFMFHEFSPGNPIWLPNGTTLYNLLSNRMRQLNLANGYVEVRTPILWKADLYKISGHLEHYQKNMYEVFDDNYNDHYLKPMNCPSHMLIFKSKQWSYADLPYRIHDQGILHRNEVSGAIGGLTRCRSFSQDDAHIFCTPEQVLQETIKLIQMIETLYKLFGMEVGAVLSTRPEKFMGEIEQWNKAEEALAKALGNLPITMVNEGAFYGPKIDFFVKDSQRREWQTATIQLDFQLPQRFELKYTDKDNQQQTPVVIHRALLGSFERFIGILLEHYQGKLPLWLSPVQGVFLPISDKHIAYCGELKPQFDNAELRVILDTSNRTLSRKILDAEEKAIPYMLVAGDKEVDGEKLSLRIEGKSQGTFSPDEILERMIVESEIL